MQWRFSRTHSQTYKQCPKLYWQTFHEAGTGLVPVRMSMGLGRGILAHAILADINALAAQLDAVPPADKIREIINEHVTAWKEEALKRGFNETEDNTYLEYEVNRQACLVEGAVRAWVLVRLPFLLQTYRIVQVEREFDVPLSDDVTLMCRLDGVLQRRDDGEYSALEFKTTSTTQDDYFESWRYSTQTMFHLLAIEKQFGKIGNSVMMEFLNMGTKRKDEMSGLDIYYSPLVRGYVKYGNPPLEPAQEYGFSTDLARKKGWTTFAVFEGNFPGKPDWMSNSEYWVEHTMPFDVIEAQLNTKEIHRNPDELAESVRNTVEQQRRIYQGVQLKVLAPSPLVDAQFFPGNLDETCNSNKWRKSCPFKAICYKEIAGDPLASGIYQKREPHHLQEGETE